MHRKSILKNVAIESYFVAGYKTLFTKTIYNESEPPGKVNKSSQMCKNTVSFKNNVIGRHLFKRSNRINHKNLGPKEDSYKEVTQNQSNNLTEYISNQTNILRSLSDLKSVADSIQPVCKHCEFLAK